MICRLRRRESAVIGSRLLAAQLEEVKVLTRKLGRFFAPNMSVRLMYSQTVADLAKTWGTFRCEVIEATTG